MEFTVVDPEALTRLASSSNLPNAHLTIKLLQPITHKAVFDANRAPETRFVKCISPDSERYLPCKKEWMHLKGLGKEWRKAWSRVPTDVGRVTFDFSMRCEEGEERIVWREEGEDLNVIDEEGFTVRIDERGVLLVVTTMISVMYVRSKGEVKMDIGLQHPRRLNRVSGSAQLSKLLRQSNGLTSTSGKRNG